MSRSESVAVPETLTNSFVRYGNLLRLELRICAFVLLVGFLVFFPTAMLFFEWFAAPHTFSDLSFVSFVFLGVFLVVLWSVVRTIWRPIEEKKREIEAEFSQNGLRISQVKGTKFDIEELEDK